jgi:hypothetical protein
MAGETIWHLVKFCAEESHADRFVAGDLFMNRLSFFKQLEAEFDDGRPDSTEAVAMWWQPHDFSMTLTVPGIGETTITKADLAGPVSMAFDHHNYFHIFCMYAVHTHGFASVDGKFNCTPEEAEELRRQIRIDERCLRFGKFAVVTPAVPFLAQLKGALQHQCWRGSGKLVRYYDEETFHGEIKIEDIPFSKQKRFSYQQEFRICIEPKTFDRDPVTINIGSIAAISAKIESLRLSDLLTLKTEPVG